MTQRSSLLLLSWLVLLGFVGSAASAQVCSDFPPLGVPGYTGTATSSFRNFNCVGIWSCAEAKPLAMSYSLSPSGCDPTTSTCTAEVAIDAEFPGNYQTYSPTPPAPIGWQAPFDSLVKLIWLNGHGQDPGTCGSPFGKITDEKGIAKLSLSFSCAAYTADPGLYRFTLAINTCQSATGCSAFSKTVAVDFAIGSALCPEPPPEDDCDGDASCKLCKLSGAGVGGGGASAAGGGGTAGGRGTGAGALLRYKAGGIGHPKLPGSTAWTTELGRYWSHDYAERIFVDASPSPAASRSTW